MLEIRRMRVVAFGMQLVPKGGSRTEDGGQVKKALKGIGNFLAKLAAGRGNKLPRFDA